MAHSGSERAGRCHMPCAALCARHAAAWRRLFIIHCHHARAIAQRACVSVMAREARYEAHVCLLPTPRHAADAPFRCLRRHVYMSPDIDAEMLMMPDFRRCRLSAFALTPMFAARSAPLMLLHAFYCCRCFRRALVLRHYAFAGHRLRHAGAMR